MDLSDKSDVNKSEESNTPLLNGISEEDCDSELLLLPCKKSCLSKKKIGKPKMKVQWNDKNGKKLAEVLEFQPRTTLTRPFKRGPIRAAQMPYVENVGQFQQPGKCSFPSLGDASDSDDEGSDSCFCTVM